MPYRYLDNIAIADAAFEAWGDSLGELFISAADAVLNVMMENPEAVAETESRTLRCEGDSPEMLLFNMIGELIFYKDAEQLFLKLKKPVIEKRHDTYVMIADAVGEAIDPEKHELNVDIKAVTFHRFALEQTARGWKATVVLDV